MRLNRADFSGPAIVRQPSVRRAVKPMRQREKLSFQLTMHPARRQVLRSPDGRALSSAHTSISRSARLRPQMRTGSTSYKRRSACRSTPGNPFALQLLARNREQQSRHELPLDDEAGVSVDKYGERPVIMDAAHIAGERGIAEQERAYPARNSWRPFGCAARALRFA